ncbi:SNF2-related protein [Aquiflexum sp. LQ15W]|uniref:helicase-related protein n=1 Tax=Cognataquiflexum nitidum TaxID=2922272 RepID=UPI001F1391E3|nr:helicase-related protein [Cognataquiflexum nitidum]MCH6198618.1 SNF2-related protein [Cognataquiflexum nitidum]
MSNFITNSQSQTSLKSRLESLITASTELRFLVGFFYFSGWQVIYQKLQENPDVKLRILVGLQVDKYLSSTIEIAAKEAGLSNEEYFAKFIKSLGFALNNPDLDTEEFYLQVSFFLELLETGRIIIKQTKEPNHAKLYLFSLKEEYRQLMNLPGTFITGSSNLTKAGLHGQMEFNVEIRDYGFQEAADFFESLWETAIPITAAPNGARQIVEFIRKKTQVSEISPFEAYALILKTYIDLQEAKNVNPAIDRLLESNGFEKYAYQIDAVNQALKVIENYNGVIIADVVGLGKSVIASLIASQIGQRGLIICPPGLIGNKQEQTGWYEYKNKFRLYDWDIESSGMVRQLADAMDANDHGYEVIIVDEAHKFRNQDTEDYEALLEICRGKKVILLSATPFNNSPADIFALLKLFIVPGASPLTLDSDLEARFANYNYNFRRLSDIIKYINSGDPNKRRRIEKYYKDIFGQEPPIELARVRNRVQEIANDIKNVITPITIRRNRLDLKADFEYKKEIDNLSEVENPKELFYELSHDQLNFYNTLISSYFIEGGRFTGAIYKPFEYEQELSREEDEDLNESDNRTLQQQRNLYDFMRRLLIKRFESSFGAFDKSIQRFLSTNRMVLTFVEQSGRYVLDRKVIEAIYNAEEDDFVLDEIERALEEFRQNAESGSRTPKHTHIYQVDEFERQDDFIRDIKNDIKLFEEIATTITRLDLVNKDPKREKVLLEILVALNQKEKGNPKRKLIIFSEYADTVRHLEQFFTQRLNGRVMICDGSISKKFALDLDANFNAKHPKQVDDYDVLITTDKLAEGFNLNRAGLIVNYDIPWNPTKVIQRVGRINRMSAKVFDKLYIYNFFPTEQGAEYVRSREIAQQKMFLIHNALGEDAKIFDPEEEPSASGLYEKINSDPEADAELSTVTSIRNAYNQIKEQHPELIEKISHLPNRIKTAKLYHENNVLVLKRKGMALFSLSGRLENGKVEVDEILFEQLLEKVKCSEETARQHLSTRFWQVYDEMKDFKKTFRKSRSKSEIDLDVKASNSLKSLLRDHEIQITQDLKDFINTIITDLRKYKTFSKFGLRQFILESSNPRKKDKEAVLEAVKIVRRKRGSDYLDIVMERTQHLEDAVVIAVENIGGSDGTDK